MKVHCTDPKSDSMDVCTRRMALSQDSFLAPEVSLPSRPVWRSVHRDFQRGY